MSTASSSRTAGSPGDFGRDVRQIVGALLTGGHPDIRLVADKFRMSARTLQRRLRDADLTYAGVVAQARCDMARRMLVVSVPKIADIARTLGYSDAAHFTRAFRRWTGVAPREFRQRRRDAAASIAPTRERRRSTRSA